MVRLWWVREDKQGSLDGGTYTSALTARAMIPAVLDELLAQLQADQSSEGRWQDSVAAIHETYPECERTVGGTA